MDHNPQIPSNSSSELLTDLNEKKEKTTDTQDPSYDKQKTFTSSEGDGPKIVEDSKLAVLVTEVKNDNNSENEGEQLITIEKSNQQEIISNQNLSDKEVTYDDNSPKEEPSIDSTKTKHEAKEFLVPQDEPKETTKVQNDSINNTVGIVIKEDVQQQLNTTSDQQDTVKLIEKKKKEDDKLAIYKALAIKLKKELVKCRDDLNKLREESQAEITNLKEKIETLEESLNFEKQTSATLEAKVKILKQQIDSTDRDLENLQDEFENYKIKASEIMQQNNPKLSNISQNFEDNLYKQMKQLNLDQQKRISSLESQLTLSLEKNQEIEHEKRLYQEKLRYIDEHLNTIQSLNNKLESLSRENENLKLTLTTFKSKLKKPNCDESEEVNTKSNIDMVNNDSNTATKSPTPDDPLDETITATRESPSVSLKDHDSHTNSSSSFDGSTSGYVHIKPTTFEIISRSSVLEDAQNQIDNLTKAYLDSESTNSLLTEQVAALKEEIRRLQRGTERMDLAENLEYLKNILFKFLTLDSGQSEQKQRLIPVLSTVLKLSPDETTKLHSLTIVDKPSMASSFFKL